MTTYSISPDLYRRNIFNDEYEDWISDCFKSKWEKPKEIEEIEEEDFMTNTIPDFSKED